MDIPLKHPGLVGLKLEYFGSMIDLSLVQFDWMDSDKLFNGKHRARTPMCLFAKGGGAPGGSNSRFCSSFFLSNEKMKGTLGKQLRIEFSSLGYL